MLHCLVIKLFHLYLLLIIYLNAHKMSLKVKTQFNFPKLSMENVSGDNLVTDSKILIISRRVGQGLPAWLCLFIIPLGSD